jgi:hypothetical protein
MIKDIKVGEYFYYDLDGHLDSYWIQVVESIDSTGYAETRFLYGNETRWFSLNSTYSDRCVKLEVEDLRDFKVGDKIRYMSAEGSPLGIQEITNIDSYWFITTINDVGRKNHFDYDSIYGKKCVLVKVSFGVDFEYDNGIPMVWGDELC